MPCQLASKDNNFTLLSNKDLQIEQKVNFALNDYFTPNKKLGRKKTQLTLLIKLGKRFGFIKEKLTILTKLRKIFLTLLTDPNKFFQAKSKSNNTLGIRPFRY